MKPLKLGHVHLKVRNLDRAIEFYQSVLGLVTTERAGPFAFLSDGEAHHTLALQERGPQAPAPSRGSIGLHHVAFEVPDEAAFTSAIERAKAYGTVSTVDHGISWATYFSDPDGNGVEIYLDRREAEGGTKTWAEHISVRSLEV